MCSSCLFKEEAEQTVTHDLPGHRSEPREVGETKEENTPAPNPSSSKKGKKQRNDRPAENRTGPGSGRRGSGAGRGLRLRQGPLQPGQDAELLGLAASPSRRPPPAARRRVPPGLRKDLSALLEN